MRATVNAFVQTIIAEYQSLHQVTVLHHELEGENMMEAGRNAASSVFRLKLVFERAGEECRSSLVVKVPQLSLSYATFEIMGLYRRERYMYEAVLRRMCRLWPGESSFPTFYAASRSGILALENLEERGFRMLQKNSFLDLRQCKVVLRTLARFHAISVKYLRIHGTEEFDKMTTLSDGTPDLGCMLAALFGKIRTYVTPALTDGQLDKWMQFERNFPAILRDVYTPGNGEGFNVILHGDLQSNNVLFKEDDCKLIDLQLSRRGSPVLDLTYFLVSCVTCEMFQRCQENIFTHYLEALNEGLERVECAERCTLEELKADFNKYRLYLVYVLSGIVPILWSGSMTSESWNEEEKNKLDDVIQSSKYISFFKKWIEVI